MSGGLLDHVYRDVENAVVYNPVDGDAATVTKEIVRLLHDIEWSVSGDYSRDRWRNTLAKFCAEWEGGYKQDTASEKVSAAELAEQSPFESERHQIGGRSEDTGSRKVTEYRHNSATFDLEDGSADIPDEAIGITVDTFGDDAVARYLLPVEGGDE